MEKQVHSYRSFLPHIAGGHECSAVLAGARDANPYGRFELDMNDRLPLE